MDKNRIFVKIILNTVCILAVLLASVHVIRAQECRIVRIHGEDREQSKKVYLEPKTLHVQKDTCVIWVKAGFNDDIRISFHDGNQCKKGTGTSVGFEVDAESCYVTTWIPSYGVSSMLFLEHGTYEYTVALKNGDKVEGKIAVQ